MGVDRLKGKFLSFLLASFQNHLSDVVDRACRHKRGGDKEFVHLDAEAAEERYRLEPVELLTAEKMFRCSGNDAPGRGLEPTAPGVRYRGKNVHVRSVKILLGP